jgi:MFS family permease
MITGIVISTAGGSMVWPFMLIYASSRLGLPLSTVATLISINAGTGLLASFLAGWVSDRIGRKVVMNFSLTMNGLAFFFLMGANTYQDFAVLMVMIGLSNPLYQVGADAMLADMIPSEKRTDAYAINRIANNAAFALGPALGGFLAARSYNLTFIGAAAGFLIYSLLLFLLARETLARKTDATTSGLSSSAKYPAVPKPLREIEPPPEGGYMEAFRDSRPCCGSSCLSTRKQISAFPRPFTAGFRPRMPSCAFSSNSRSPASPGVIAPCLWLPPAC